MPRKNVTKVWNHAVGYLLLFVLVGSALMGLAIQNQWGTFEQGSYYESYYTTENVRLGPFQFNTGEAVVSADVWANHTTKEDVTFTTRTNLEGWADFGSNVFYAGTYSVSVIQNGMELLSTSVTFDENGSWISGADGVFQNIMKTIDEVNLGPFYYSDGETYLDGLTASLTSLRSSPTEIENGMAVMTSVTTGDHTLYIKNGTTDYITPTVITVRSTGMVVYNTDDSAAPLANYYHNPTIGPLELADSTPIRSDSVGIKPLNGTAVTKSTDENGTVGGDGDMPTGNYTLTVTDGDIALLEFPLRLEDKIYYDTGDGKLPKAPYILGMTIGPFLMDDDSVAQDVTVTVTYEDVEVSGTYESGNWSTTEYLHIGEYNVTVEDMDGEIIDEFVLTIQADGSIIYDLQTIEGKGLILGPFTYASGKAIVGGFVTLDDGEDTRTEYRSQATDDEGYAQFTQDIPEGDYDVIVEDKDGTVVAKGSIKLGSGGVITLGELPQAPDWADPDSDDFLDLDDFERSGEDYTDAEGDVYSLFENPDDVSVRTGTVGGHDDMDIASIQVETLGYAELTVTITFVDDLSDDAYVYLWVVTDDWAEGAVDIGTVEIDPLFGHLGDEPEDDILYLSYGGILSDPGITVDGDELVAVIPMEDLMDSDDFEPGSFQVFVKSYMEESNLEDLPTTYVYDTAGYGSVDAPAAYGSGGGDDDDDADDDDTGSSGDDDESFMEKYGMILIIAVVAVIVVVLVLVLVIKRRKPESEEDADDARQAEIQSHIDAGNDAYMAGNYADAIIAWQKAISLNPQGNNQPIIQSIEMAQEQMSAPRAPEATCPQCNFPLSATDTVCPNCNVSLVEEPVDQDLNEEDLAMLEGIELETLEDDAGDGGDEMGSEPELDDDDIADDIDQDLGDDELGDVEEDEDLDSADLDLDDDMEDLDEVEFDE